MTATPPRWRGQATIGAIAGATLDDLDTTEAGILDAAARNAADNGAAHATTVMLIALATDLEHERTRRFDAAATAIDVSLPPLPEILES